MNQDLQTIVATYESPNGDAVVWSCTPQGRNHRVRYCEYVTNRLDDFQAAEEFGECVRHAAYAAGVFRGSPERIHFGTLSVRNANSLIREEWLNPHGAWGPYEDRKRFHTHDDVQEFVAKCFGADFEQFGVFPNS